MVTESVPWYLAIELLAFVAQAVGQQWFRVAGNSYNSMDSEASGMLLRPFFNVVSGL